jgi:ankyrin repeat protein
VFGNTPLINLAKKNAMTTKYTLLQRLETAVYLLEKGARINHKNREGMSALTVAARDRKWFLVATAPPFWTQVSVLCR